VSEKDFFQEAATKNRLREVRLSHGLSQGELADKAGVSRQTIGGIEAELYGPSLAVALRLAKVFGKKLEEIFWLEREPASEVFCQWSGIGPVPEDGAHIQLIRSGTGYAAYPASRELLGLEANAIVLHKDRGQIKSKVLVQESLEQSPIVLAGCSPVLGLLRQRLHNICRDVSLLWVNTNSARALAALKNGTAHVAGIHIFDEQTGRYNLPAVQKALGDRPHVVINLYHGEQGLLLQKGNRKGIRDFSDLARDGVKVVNREEGAESRRILDAGLQASKLNPWQIAGYDFPVATHQEVAQAVAFGGADCGVALRPLARVYGLDFMPLTRERFDLVILREYLHEPGIQAVLDFLQKQAIRLEMEACGYEPEATGSEITC
jgi:molybdate-binding protein/DNA-binding XRE family transcriptional regulator